MARDKTISASKEDQAVLAEALERYEICRPVCDEIYNAALDDKKFATGEQWSTADLKGRDDRPSLVENRLAGTIHQVCNDQRQNRPMMKVMPVDEVGDPDTAEIINGILRHIQYSSDSETAFDTGFRDAVKGGIGWCRVVTDYCDDEGFEQEIIIKRVANFMSVIAPMHLCHEIDFRDMPYCFVEEVISKDEFKRQWPKVPVEEWKSSERWRSWVNDDTVKIAEYFVLEREKTGTMYLLSDGQKLDRAPTDEELGVEGQRLSVVSKRDKYKRSVKWYKITAGHILEKNDFPGKWIPVIPMIGEEENLDGKLVLISLTRNAKDPQKMLNYWRSSEAEKIALAPKAPYVAADTQVEAYQAEWDVANTKNLPYLRYTPRSESGTLIPPPRREQPVQLDTAYVNAARESIDAIKACTGIFDAGLGAQGNEKSGRAILARQREGDTANFHFPDNAAKSLRHCCRVIIDMIPEVYDTDRTVRILGEDMKPKIVKVNAEHAGEDGKQKLYNLTVGKYDVMVETGPSYASKREETAANLMQLGQNDPQLIMSSRDLLMKYLGMPAEVVERVQKTIPPQLLDDKQQKPQQMQAALAQSQQMISQLDQVIQKMSAELEQAKSGLAGKQMDNETKLVIAKLQAQVDLLIAQMRSDDQHNDRAHERGMEAVRQVYKSVSDEVAASRQPQETEQPQPPAGVAER